jgi:hypothetical protein
MIRMARGETDLRGVVSGSGLDLDFFIHRSRSLDEILPWDHIDNGMSRRHLESHYVEAMKTLGLVPK